MNKKRITAQEAGYLELPNATKDSDCSVVEVQGGVSSERGCCNSFGWKTEDVEYFRCGECKYLSDRADEPDETKPLSQREANKMTLRDILDSVRPAEVKQ